MGSRQRIHAEFLGVLRSNRMASNRDLMVARINGDFGGSSTHLLPVHIVDRDRNKTPRKIVACALGVLALLELMFCVAHAGKITAATSGKRHSIRNAKLILPVLDNISAPHRHAALLFILNRRDKERVDDWDKSASAPTAARSI
jgi:hypothetical protein